MYYRVGIYKSNFYSCVFVCTFACMSSHNFNLCLSSIFLSLWSKFHHQKVESYGHTFASVEIVLYWSTTFPDKFRFLYTSRMWCLLLLLWVGVTEFRSWLCSSLYVSSSFWCSGITKEKEVISIRQKEENTHAHTWSSHSSIILLHMIGNVRREMRFESLPKERRKEKKWEQEISLSSLLFLPPTSITKAFYLPFASP